jgi:hypothetical protein
MIEPVAIGRQRDVDLNLEAGLAKALGQSVGSGLSDVIDVVVREDVQADDAGRLEGLGFRSRTALTGMTSRARAYCAKSPPRPTRAESNRHE